MRPAKKIVGLFALVLLLAIAFWLGRVTGREKKAQIGHEEAPKSMASSSEEVSHERTGNDAHGDETGAKPSGLILTAEQKANIGLQTVTAELRPIENVIRVVGVVRPYPDREAQVNSRVSGKIAALFFQVGDRVRKGQRLAEVQSAEIQRLQTDLMQADNKLVLAKADLERIQKLVESKIAARKQLIAAQNDYQALRNEIEGVEKQLVLLGIPESAVKKARVAKSIATFPIVAQIGGFVAERNVVLGESVEPSKVLFKILDLSVVLIEGDAFEESLRELKTGQTVRIRLASYPDEVFAGEISRFSPTIDPEKRTLRFWAEVANPSGKLKPNLFSEVSIVVNEGVKVLAIPQEALISTEGEHFVFVEKNGSFRRADLVLGARDDRYVEVKKGLHPGEQVVSDGKQQVYTQYLTAQRGGAALGGHAH